MRRLPVSIVVALILVLASELAVRAVAPKLDTPLTWADRETQNKAAAMEKLGRTGGAAVVFVGSSMTNAAADPALATKLLGLKRPAFNAALDGGGFPALEFWTLHVVVPQLHPRVVVIGLSSRELNDAGANQASFNQKFFGSEAVQRMDGAADTLRRVEGWAEDHSYLFRYRTILRRPTLAKAQHRPTDVDRLGVTASIVPFRGRPFGFGQKFVDRIERGALNNYHVGGAALASLGRLVDGLVKQHIRPVLVEMPLTSDVMGMHPHGAADYNAFERALQAFATGRGVELDDLRSSFTGHAEFVDPLHLDNAGSRRFTRILAGLLKQAAPAA